MRRSREQLGPKHAPSGRESTGSIAVTFETGSPAISKTSEAPRIHGRAADTACWPQPASDRVGAAPTTQRSTQSAPAIARLALVASDETIATQLPDRQRRQRVPKNRTRRVRSPQGPATYNSIFFDMYESRPTRLAGQRKCFLRSPSCEAGSARADEYYAVTDSGVAFSFVSRLDSCESLSADSGHAPNAGNLRELHRVRSVPSVSTRPPNLLSCLDLVRGQYPANILQSKELNPRIVIMARVSACPVVPMLSATPIP